MKYKFFTLFIWIPFLASAQNEKSIQILNAMVNKIENSRNVSYESLITEKKLFVADTLNRSMKGTVFIDSLGKVSSSDFILKNNKYIAHHIYTNQKEYSLESDKSYSIQNREEYLSGFGDLFGPGGIVAAIKRTITNYPQNICLKNDTIVNKIQCTRLDIVAFDSIIEKEHVFSKISIYIDKNNILPKLTIFQGHAVMSKENFKVGSYDMYNKSYYKKIQLNVIKKNYLENFKIPSKYHLSKENKLLEKGIIAPYWKKSGLDGKIYSSKNYKGKVSLLFLSGIDCPANQLSTPMLNRLSNKFDKKIFNILGIFPEKKKTLQIYNVENNLNFPIIYEGMNIKKDYNSPGSPYFYIIDKKGIIVYSKIGYSSDLEKELTSIIKKTLAD